MDIAKIRNDLGWLPKHEIDSGLRETVNWYLDNMDWVKTIMAQDGYGSWLDKNYANRGEK
jgi:dTDP-glucose 4,6-dehydratase